jgi:hypothetical protein
MFTRKIKYYDEDENTKYRYVKIIGRFVGKYGLFLSFDNVVVNDSIDGNYSVTSNVNVMYYWINNVKHLSNNKTYDIAYMLNHKHPEANDAETILMLNDYITPEPIDVKKYGFEYPTFNSWNILY